MKLQVLWMHKYQIMLVHKTCQDFVLEHLIFLEITLHPSAPLQFSTRCELRQIDWINIYLGK